MIIINDITAITMQKQGSTELTIRRSKLELLHMKAALKQIRAAPKQKLSAPPAPDLLGDP